MDTLRKEFQQYIENGMWQGEDEYTKNFPIGNVTEWWIGKIEQEIVMHNANILNEYQKAYLGEDERKLWKPIENATKITMGVKDNEQSTSN